MGMWICMRECLARKEKIWVPPHRTPKPVLIPPPFPICCLMWGVVPSNLDHAAPMRNMSPLSWCYQKLKFCCLIKLLRGPSLLWILPRWLFTPKSMTETRHLSPVWSGHTLCSPRAWADFIDGRVKQPGESGRAAAWDGSSFPLRSHSSPTHTQADTTHPGSHCVSRDVSEQWFFQCPVKIPHIPDDHRSSFKAFFLSQEPLQVSFLCPTIPVVGLKSMVLPSPCSWHCLIFLSWYEAQGSLKFIILLTQSPECWDYRSMLLFLLTPRFLGEHP